MGGRRSVAMAASISNNARDHRVDASSDDEEDNYNNNNNEPNESNDSDTHMFDAVYGDGVNPEDMY